MKNPIRKNVRVYHRDAALVRDVTGTPIMYGTVVKKVKSTYDELVRVLWDSGSSAVHTVSSLRVKQDTEPAVTWVPNTAKEVSK